MRARAITARGAPVGTTMIAIAAVALIAALGAAAGPVAASAEAATCTNANRPAADLSRQALRRATICRINHLRANRGRDAVRRQSQLQRVAQRHTRVMVRERCLKHRCPGEPPLERRIRRSGYLDGARRWRFTQNTGCAPTARAMVRAWRESSFHRQNMLGGRLEHIGVGTALRPARPAVCGQDAATFTALLAWRAP